MTKDGKIRRIGLVGCGTIGSRILQRIRESGQGEVVFVCDQEEKARLAAGDAKAVARLEDIGAFDVDLVIEAANAEVVRSIALDVVKSCHFLPFTVTAFADQGFHDAVKAGCQEAGTCVYIPHGAILGLDGVFDGRHIIENVTITTTKSPQSLGLAEPKAQTIYDGPTRKACSLFPRNVNVHAALALAGIGFDRQRSVIRADPETTVMRHDIAVAGDGLEWTIGVSGRPVGKVTGKYTPESASSTVLRILRGQPGFTLA